jgi:hypothetical protein
MARTIRRLLLALVVIFAVAIASFIVFTRVGLPAPPTLPNPNGHDDFVKAAEATSGSFGDFRELDHDSLEALVSDNAEPLRLLRVGLTRQCVAPMDSALANTTGLLNELGGMKRLVQLLAAEGRLREMENRPADAARCYTDAIRFGNEMSRGGVLITRLVGVACEAIGCKALASIVPKLDRENSRVFFTDLERVDAGRITWAEVLRGEHYFSRYQLRNQPNPLPWLWGRWQNRQAVQKAEAKHKTVVAHERLLAGELALRCSRLEQGRVPARLDDLVTNYLSRVPEDPFTSQPMIYRPQGTNWLLYSVGPDGVDDGGRPAGRGWPVKGDILFDSTW